jgi:hypothetical protein
MKESDKQFAIDLIMDIHNSISIPVKHLSVRSFDFMLRSCEHGHGGHVAHMYNLASTDAKEMAIEILLTHLCKNPRP